MKCYTQTPYPRQPPNACCRGPGKGLVLTVGLLSTVSRAASFHVTYIPLATPTFPNNRWERHPPTCPANDTGKAGVSQEETASLLFLAPELLR